MRDIIVIGGSAGGLEGARAVVGGLPADLPASVLVVIHIPSYGVSYLPEILGKSGPLPASHAEDGESLRRGHIYVAPPDRHLLIDERHVLVRAGPKENRFRPSIDALFRSAAYVHGTRVIGVVLSGVLDDGISGLWSIKRLGGLALAQSPDDTLHPDMPRAAIEQVEVDHVRPATELGLLLATLVGEPAKETPTLDDASLQRLGLEIDIAARSGAFDKGILKWGDIAPFTCPDCHGALVRFEEGNLLRFRCNTGHAFTPRSLLAGITETIEGTIGEAMHGFGEQTLMLEYLAEHSREAGHEAAAALFLGNARDSRTRAERINDLLPEQRQLTEDIGVELPPRAR